MAQRGRPRRASRPKIYSVKLVLYAHQDDDLISYLEAVPCRKRASAVKVAMRSGNIACVALDTLDDDEILDAFEGLLI